MELTFITHIIKQLLSRSITPHSHLISATPQQSPATRPVSCPGPLHNGHLDRKEVHHSPIHLPKHRAHMKQYLMRRTILPIVYQHNLDRGLRSDSLADLRNGSAIRFRALKQARVLAKDF